MSGKEGCGDGVSLGEVSKRLAKFVGREAGGMGKVEGKGREKAVFLACRRGGCLFSKGIWGGKSRG